MYTRKSTLKQSKVLQWKSAVIYFFKIKYLTNHIINLDFVKVLKLPFLEISAPKTQNQHSHMTKNFNFHAKYIFSALGIPKFCQFRSSSYCFRDKIFLRQKRRIFKVT